MTRTTANVNTRVIPRRSAEKVRPPVPLLQPYFNHTKTLRSSPHSHPNSTPHPPANPPLLFCWGRSLLISERKTRIAWVCFRYSCLLLDAPVDTTPKAFLYRKRILGDRVVKVWQITLTSSSESRPPTPPLLPTDPSCRVKCSSVFITRHVVYGSAWWVLQFRCRKRFLRLIQHSWCFLCYVAANAFCTCFRRSGRASA